MSIRAQNALTLTELLVSTILMGIVMTGVAAFSLFVKQARDSTGSGTILAVQTATAMHYLVADANKAVGDSGDRGIITSSASTGGICFRYDNNNPPTAIYADDIWSCYYVGSSYGLHKCGPTSPVPPTNGSQCNSPRIKLVELADRNYFKVVDDADGRFQYVDIPLNTIADRGRPADTIANPTYQLFTRISPPAHGR